MPVWSGTLGSYRPIAADIEWSQFGNFMQFHKQLHLEVKVVFLPSGKVATMKRGWSRCMGFMIPMSNTVSCTGFRAINSRSSLSRTPRLLATLNQNA